MPAPARRSRRRFSLPPLDEDHEKVNRSIETFLGGPDGTPAESATAGAGGATTVAIVVIDGLRWRRRTRRAAPQRPAGSDLPSDPRAADVDAPAMVERTLRGAARGSDVVSVGRTGRFRVVLPGTGELAARAYLRRVRASVEPILEASDDPLQLVVATATVLGGSVDEAIRAAERRLAVLLEAAHARPADPIRPAGGGVDGRLDAAPGGGAPDGAAPGGAAPDPRAAPD